MTGVGRSRSTSWCRRCPAGPDSLADPAQVQLTVSLYLLRPGRGAARARAAVRPLRPPAGRARGLALATIASTAAIFAASIASLIVARVAQALGASTGIPSAAPSSATCTTATAASMIGLVTSVVVLMPMAAPLVGGVLDTLFGWEAIFVFTAPEPHGVRLGGAGLPETRKRARRSRANGSFPRRHAALAAARASSATRCARRSARRHVLHLLGGAPHVVVTMLGRTSAEYGLWFFVPRSDSWPAISRCRGSGASASTP